MVITLDTLPFLASDRGQSLLEALRTRDLSDKNTLALIQNLRKQVDAGQASALLTLARLRAKAVAKFGDDAHRMYFTEEALQQASHPWVRAYRAEQWAGLAVVDMGCSIGSDSLAFARRGAASVIGYDLDGLRVEMARLNADVLGLAASFVVEDVTTVHPPAQSAVFFDPARRDERGNRIYDVQRYIPPLDTLLRWRTAMRMAKISPGVDLGQLPADPTGDVQFISVDGELKEALYSIHASATGRVWAVLLTRQGALHWEADDAVAQLSEPRAWLVEPDPALIRAGLVQSVTASFAGSMLDETIAYFTTDEAPSSPWVRAWRIREWMPFHLKRLRAALRERGVGTVTVKKRGSPITPEELTRQLKLKGEEACTVVLTRLQGEPIVIICDDIK